MLRSRTTGLTTMHRGTGVLSRSPTTKALTWWRGRVAVALAFVSALSYSEAAAQTPSCVAQPIPAPPPRQVLRCSDGLTIEAEVSAAYSLRVRSPRSRPHAALLQGGALLVNAPPEASAAGFQVLTPQAVAAVRGTQWAVEVGEAKTAVFVVNGQVTVRRSTSRRAVTLGPGEGVDVTVDTAPLSVRRWSPERAASLLARFGR
jgi:ferric-dicitrate binding protein FerR (iron transport regulator)